MCECIEKVISNAKDHMAEKINKEFGVQSIGRAYFENQIFYMESGRQIPFSIPFVVEYERKSRKGNTRDYKKKTNVFPTYCCFCGEKYEAQ